MAQESTSPPPDIDSVQAYLAAVDNFRQGLRKRYEIFFRGEDDCAYDFGAGFFRGTIRVGEKQILEEFVSYFHDECRDKTCFEKLLMAQHYGLPTRLLDITLNPLVALYFACKENTKKKGQVYALYTHQDKILSVDSDRLNIISHLAFLNRKDKVELRAEVEKADSEGYDCISTYKFTDELQKDKPAYRGDIFLEHLTETYFVKPIYSNPRIRAQAGGFLLTGIILKSKRVPKKVICHVSNKTAILEELDRLGINELTLFPEKEHAANYLKWKYCR